uniref:Uncharacterized protein n=1 Tax=Lepeophtheirus salmonis TaxID=72036 RepID=A0A0K2T1G6_LEPSM
MEISFIMQMPLSLRIVI